MIPLDDEPAILGAATTRAAEPTRRRRRRRAAGPDQEEKKAARPAIPLGEYSDIVYVWEPHTPQLPPLKPYLKALWARRHLMKAMAHADLRARESRTFLGRLWWLIDPLIQAAIFYMVFGFVRGGGHQTDILPRLVTAIFLFNLATVSMGDAGGSIRGSRHLLFNSDFPRAMLPLTTIYKGLQRFIPAIPVIFLVVVALDSPITWAMLLIPVLFVFQLIMMVGLSLFCAAATVLIPDAQNVIGYVTRVFFFTTPIIWAIESVPERIRPFLHLQPFYSLFASYQTIILGDVPSWRMLAPIPVWSFGMLLLGVWVFLRREREFAVRL